MHAFRHVFSQTSVQRRRKIKTFHAETEKAPWRPSFPPPPHFPRSFQPIETLSPGGTYTHTHTHSSVSMHIKGERRRGSLFFLPEQPCAHGGFLHFPPSPPLASHPNPQVLYVETLYRVCVSVFSALSLSFSFSLPTDHLTFVVTVLVQWL